MDLPRGILRHADSFFEIELKALLTPENYQRLLIELPQQFTQINEDTIHTTRYRPGDIRLRHSDKILEMVIKDGDPTKICRFEKKVDFPNRRAFNAMRRFFELSGNYKADPPWMKHKHEFECWSGSYKYVICLQDIKDFAYILEVEHLSETDDSLLHISALESIARGLGCEPIEPAEFTDRIKAYISAKRA